MRQQSTRPRLESCDVRGDVKYISQVKAELEANAKAAKERAECINGVQWVERFRLWFQQNRSAIFDELRKHDMDGLSGFGDAGQLSRC